MRPPALKVPVSRVVERELRPRARRKVRLRPPLVRSKAPGRLRLTNERIYEIIPFP